MQVTLLPKKVTYRAVLSGLRISCLVLCRLELSISRKDQRPKVPMLFTPGTYSWVGAGWRRGCGLDDALGLGSNNDLGQLQGRVIDAVGWHVTMETW